jgi:hypothetical protein
MYLKAIYDIHIYSVEAYEIVVLNVTTEGTREII